MSPTAPSNPARPASGAPQQIPRQRSVRPAHSVAASAGFPLDFTHRARDLLNAFIAISIDLDLQSLLGRTVEAACELTSARCGALGVIGEDGVLSDFVTAGLSDAQQHGIGARPQGPGPNGETFLGVPITIRGTVFGNLYLTEKQEGARFTEEDQLLVSALATAAGFLIENAQAFALSERHRQWLEASVRISETLQPPIQLRDALQQVATAATLVTRARAVVIVQRIDSVHYAVTAGDGPQVHRGPEIAARLEPVFLQCELDGLQQVVESADGPVLLVPLKAHLAAGGVLVALLDDGRGSLETEERELLDAFADQASLALDRTHSQHEREDLALVWDRDRIARDLHGVIQQIFASGLQLQGLSGLTTDQVVADRINQTVKDMDNTILDIRRRIFALQSRHRPSLRAAAQILVEEYEPVLGFTAKLRIVGPVGSRVSPLVAGHLLVVLREGLSNVARHAEATSVWVDIEVIEDEVVLRVTDNGTGLPKDRDESGLHIVRHRAHELGGTLGLHATEPHGTSLEWCVPLPASQPDVIPTGG